MAVSIAKLIPAAVKLQVAWHYTLLSQWQTIMGVLSLKAIIYKIEKSTVILGVYDSCWLQELYLLTPLLLDKINASLDNPHVKEIRFKRIVKQKEEKKRIDQPKTMSVEKTYSITDYEEKALETIHDSELRNALIAFRYRIFMTSTYQM